MRTLLRRALLVGLLLAPTVASAGKGGSAAEIAFAVRSGSVDGIVASLERAEYRLCGACLDVVVPLLDHDSPRVREAAAWWLRKRPANRELVSRMTTRLAEMPSPTLARNAAEALGHFRDPAAVPVLGRVLADAQKPVEVRQAAAYALGAIGHPEAAAALKVALTDSAAGVRLQAVRALRLVRQYREAQPLLPLVSDSDVLVRRASVLLLGQIRDAQAVPALVAALQGDSDKRVRRQAAWALGRIGDRTAFAALSEAVQRDPDSFVRAQARSALKQLK